MDSTAASGLQALRAEASPLHDRQTVEDAFIALARSCVRQWQGNVAGASQAEADEAAEFIHQIRVALRRLRSVLKVFAPALPGAFTETWPQRLRDNADRFGPARDLDVLRTELLDAIAPEWLVGTVTFRDLIDVVDAERHAAHEAAKRALDPAEQARIILAFSADLLQLQGSGPDPGLKLAEFARERLIRAQRRARERFNAASGLEPAQLHRLRISLKELRYAVEFFAPLFGRKTVRAYLEQLTQAQTLLGYLQDMEVARGWLAIWTHEAPSLSLVAGFVLGWHGPRYASFRSQVLENTRPVLWGSAPWKHR
ncbi:MAG: CHAD domain-containing protein [Thauera sp.]|jgi:CHAD domain-containing protein